MNHIVNRILRLLPDKSYLLVQYYKNFHCLPNLKEPKTFSEKILWLKLHDRNPLFTTMVDKFLAKKYVASIIGEKYVIPTYGVWKKAEEIDWEALPNQFVIKTNHSGGNNGVIICKDKSLFDTADAVKRLNESLKHNSFYYGREWPYKNVKKCIIAEQLITFSDTNEVKDLPDYKFFCFNGEPLYCQVIRDRNTKETIDFYDMNWQHQEFVGLNPVASNGLTPVARPENLDEMRRLCRSLSKNRPFLRVDLYSAGSKIYFGELTFYPASGIGTFSPEIWQEKLGNLININI